MINLNKKKKYLLGCSFGPDSMALFSILLEEGYDFEVAHVNYNLREESVLERDRLIEFCDANDTKIHVLNIDKGSINGNVESICRDIRYNYFKNIYEEGNFDALLIAHHLNDHIETYYLQKSRKSKVSHFGLAEKRHIFSMEVYRPLLSFTKEELLEIVESRNVPYCIDKTNELDIYTRNKIRHNIVDKLSKEEMLKICEEINKKNAEIKELRAFFENLDLNSVKDMSNLDDEKFAAALYEDLYFVMGYSEEKITISFAYAKEIKKELKSNKSNIEFPLSENLSYIKAYDRCYFAKKEDNISYEFILDKPQILDTKYFYLDFTSNSKNRNVNIKDYPIIIRNLKPNDIFEINGYEVKARRAFIDWKMPIHLRKIWPCIVSKEGKILYVPRYKGDFIIDASLNFYVKL